MTTAKRRVASLFGYARARLAYAEPTEVPRLVVNFVRTELQSRLWDRLEQRVYVCSADRVRSLPNPRRLRRDCLADFECYQRAGFHHQLEKEALLQVAEQRLQSGHHSYTLVEDGVLLHYGWLTDRQTFAPDHKVGLAFVPLPESAVVWDNFSHPRGRGRGLMQQMLYQSLHDAVDLAHAQRVYGYVFSDNAASARSCEKAGFEHAGSLVREVRFGRVRRYGIAHAQQSFEVRPL